jgi:hypothetical protein
MAPPKKSPPIKFGFHSSSAAGEETDLDKMQSRKSGAKRAIRPLDRFGIVFRASVRNVAVSPGGLLARRCSTRVECRRLTDKHKWPVGCETSF